MLFPHAMVAWVSKLAVNKSSPLWLAALVLSGCQLTSLSEQSSFALHNGGAASVQTTLGGQLQLPSAAQQALSDAIRAELETAPPRAARAWKHRRLRGNLTFGAPFSVNDVRCRSVRLDVMGDGGRRSAKDTLCRTDANGWRSVTLGRSRAASDD